MATDPETFPTIIRRVRTDDAVARVGAKTRAEIDANPDTDPDNPTWTAEDLARAVRERDDRLARQQPNVGSDPLFE